MKRLGTDARLKKNLQSILNLTVNEDAAMNNANNPSASNPFATISDITGLVTKVEIEIDSDVIDAIGITFDDSSAGEEEGVWYVSLSIPELTEDVIQNSIIQSFLIITQESADSRISIPGNMFYGETGTSIQWQVIYSEGTLQISLRSTISMAELFASGIFKSVCILIFN